MSDNAVVLAVRHQDEREALSNMLEEQGLTIFHASTGRDVIQLVEDNHCGLLLTDIQLPDMHAWNMLNKINEIKPPLNVSMIVLTDALSVAPLKNVKLVVRPVALTTLKQIIKDWSVSQS